MADMTKPPMHPDTFSKPGGDKGVDSPETPGKFKEKRYFNKVVESATPLEPTHLDNLSEEGWKMIAATAHPQGSGMLYYFRRRRE